MTAEYRVGIRTFTVDTFPGQSVVVQQAFIESASTTALPDGAGNWEERDIYMTPLLPPEMRFLLRDTYLEEVEAELRSAMERGPS